MPLLDRIGPDTVAKLQRAADLRLEESRSLTENGHFLAAIYLQGYAAEMIIGSAYFKSVLRYGLNEEITAERLRSVLDASKQLSTMKDKSHPLDGLARTLVKNKQSLAPPAYDKLLATRIIKYSETIAANWGPKLRYRSTVPAPREIDAVRESVEWIFLNAPKF